ncbi:CarD family transcriptional regulator [bacterium 210820-DFI.6.37]|nr:CarD family transcriptional regulator [bacterium 210820-DFI.6.37]
MFQINDTVLYGAEGVFKIAEVTEMDFKNGKMDYFVLKSLSNENATIFVPTENEALMAKMRRVLSADEIYEMIKAMPEESPIWIEDESIRMKEYKEILLRGDHREIVKLIKALYLHRQKQKEIGKNLHKIDERFLKDAEKLLYDEFAYVLNIQPEQVLPFIHEQIQVDEKAV